jgi:predicted lipoprotein
LSCGSSAGHNHEAGSREASAAHRIAIAAKSREHATEILQAWEVEVEGIEVEWLDEGYATDSQE